MTVLCGVSCGEIENRGRHFPCLKAIQLKACAWWGDAGLWQGLRARGGRGVGQGESTGRGELQELGHLSK